MAWFDFVDLLLAPASSPWVVLVSGLIVVLFLALPLPSPSVSFRPSRPRVFDVLVLILAGGLLPLAVWLGPRLVQQASTPYNVRELLAPAPAWVLCGLVALCIMTAAAMDALAGWWRGRPLRFAACLAPLLVGGSAVAFLVLWLLAPGESLDDIVGSPVWKIGRFAEQGLRFLGLAASPLALLILGARLARGQFSRRDAPAVLAVLAIAAAGYYIVVVAAGTDNLVELLRGGGDWRFVVYAAAAALVSGAVAARAAAWCRASGLYRPWGYLIVLLALAATAPLAWRALVGATNPSLDKYDQVFAARQFLLSPDRDHYLPDRELAPRFAIAWWTGIGLLSLGAAISQFWFRLPPSPQHGASPSSGLYRIRTPIREVVGPSDTSATDERRLARRARAVLLAVWCGAALALLLGSWAPFEMRALPLAEGGRMFLEVLRSPGTASRLDWALNWTVAAPLAFLANAVLAVWPPRKGVAAWLVSLAAWLVCCGITLLAEFGQLWIPGRVTSRHDILAQISGALVGVAVFRACGPAFLRWLRPLVSGRSRFGYWEWLLQAYVVGLAAYSMLPFDVITSPNELMAKYRGGMIELAPFTHPYASTAERWFSYFCDVLLYVPIGAAASWCWLNGAARRSAPVALGCVALWAIGVESLQLFIGSRFTSITDVLLAVLGGGLGIVLSRYAALLGRGHSPGAPPAQHAARATAVWWLISAAYALFLAMIFWAPYDFRRDSNEIRLAIDAFFAAPLTRLQAGSHVGGLFAVLNKLAWFFPLGLATGMACCIRPLRERRLQGALLLGAALYLALVALAIEAVQVLLPGRVADATDAVLQGTAALLGLAIVAWGMRSQVGRSV